MAEKLSQGLWALSRPESIRINDITDKLFPTIICLDNSVWIICDTLLDAPIHDTAILGEIADVLNPWIIDGILPQDTNDIIQ